MNFDKNISGKTYTATGAEITWWTLRSDGRFAGTSIDASAADYRVYATLTGWTAAGRDGTKYYQATNGEYIDMSDGWKLYEAAPIYSQSAAQRLVDQIIRNNRTIIANNLLCARYSGKLTAEQRQQVRDLQSRLEKRNSALIEAGVCSGLSKSYPQDYIELQPYLDQLMQAGAVSGVGSVTVAIVVTAVVIASLSTAAYFAYKYYAAESEQDVKFSKDLTKALTSKLTPEEYQQLLQETKGKLTKAKILANIGSTGRLLILAGVAAGGYFLYKTLTRQ